MHFTLPELTGHSALDIDLSMLQSLAGYLAPDYSYAKYIPAARTGLMLALNILVGSSLGALSQENENAQRLGLTLPVLDFLQSVYVAGEYRVYPVFFDR